MDLYFFVMLNFVLFKVELRGLRYSILCNLSFLIIMSFRIILNWLNSGFLLLNNFLSNIKFKLSK